MGKMLASVVYISVHPIVPFREVMVDGHPLHRLQ